MENKKKGPGSDAKMRVRASIYPLAGIYLIYNAWCMYGEISSTSGNQQILMIVFSILYAVIGVALILLGISLLSKATRKKKDEQEEEPYDPS